jgi:parallel beta-helix repeat protein
VPIFERTTITDPGTYYLTRDIVVTDGMPAIEIQADNVTVDLNCHTISATGSSPANGLIYSQGHVNLRVTNGNLLQGGIRFDVPGGGGCGVLQADNLTVNCPMCGGAIQFIGHSSPGSSCVTVRIADNQLLGEAIGLNYIDGGQVERNWTQGFFYLQNVRNLIVADNTLALSFVPMFAIGLEGSDPQYTGKNIIRDNVMTVASSGGQGIHVQSAGDTITGNQVRGFQQGIRLDGIASLLRDNDISGCQDGVSGDAAIIDSNRIYGNTGVGIMSGWAGGTRTVRKNDVMNNMMGGMRLAGSNMKVTDNTVSYTGTGPGIDIWSGATGCEVSRNTCIGNSADGIHLMGANTNILDGNLCGKNGGYGINFDGGSTGNFYSNNHDPSNTLGTINPGTGNIDGGGNT